MHKQKGSPVLPLWKPSDTNTLVQAHWHPSSQQSSCQPELEGQAEVFWLQGKRLSVVRDTHGLLFEQLDKRGRWPWQQQRERDDAVGASTTLQYVPYSEILSVRYLPIKRYCLALTRQQRKHHFFELQVLRRHPGRPWQWGLSTMQLSCEQQGVAKAWVQQIQAALQQLDSRPKHLLVFVNPFGGRRQAPKVWQRVAAPVLAAAGTQCDVLETTHQGHAESVVRSLSQQQLQQLDGVVAVGGDGLYSELLTGVLQHPHAAAALQLRLAHIPAGSTDAVACTLHGTRDPLTAALHIALGDCTPLDVARLVTVDTQPAAGVAPSTAAALAEPAATAAAAAACAAALGASFGASAGEETELLRAGRAAPQAAAAAAAAAADAATAPPSKQQQQQRHTRRRQQQHKQHERRQQQQFVPLLRHFVCVASYGFLGDVMEASEKLRWMGPLRYDVAGALSFLLLKGYDATVRYKPAAAPAAPVDDEDVASSSSSAAPCGHYSQQQQQQHGLLEPLVSSAALSPLPHHYTPGLHVGQPAYNHSHQQQQQQQQGCSSVRSSSSVRVSFESRSLPAAASSSSSSSSSPVHGSSNAAASGSAAGSSAEYLAAVDAATAAPPGKAIAQQHGYPAVAAVHASAGSISSSWGSSSAAAANAASQPAGSIAGSIGSSSYCRTGCALCGAAALQRSSSRKSFTQESQQQQQQQQQHAHSMPAATTFPPTQAGTQAAAAAEQPPGAGWVKVEGRFASIMAVVTSCRSGKSRSGVCPEAHLADGRLVLVLVEKKGRLAYLRFLLQLATQGVVPGALPFVRVEHVTEVQVHARGKQSSWNVDGELLRHPRVHIGVHAGLVDVFARGIEQM